MRQPDFALYCASKETVSNWAFSYSVSEKQIQIFKRQKLLPLCLCAITFLLSKAELFVSATHIVVIQASLLDSNFSMIVPTGVGYFVSGEVRYGRRQVPQAKEDLAKSTLAFLLALTSLLPASKLQLNMHCGGSFSDPPSSLTLKNNNKNIRFETIIFSALQTRDCSTRSQGLRLPIIG